jgi:hypothetical protein
MQGALVHRDMCRSPSKLDGIASCTSACKLIFTAVLGHDLHAVVNAMVVA